MLAAWAEENVYHACKEYNGLVYGRTAVRFVMPVAWAGG